MEFFTEYPELRDRMRGMQTVAEHHANELAYWRAHCENLSQLLVERVQMTPPPVMMADKDSFEAGRLLGAREEREACAKLCNDLIETLLGYRDKAGAEIVVSLRDSIRARGAA